MQRASKSSLASVYTITCLRTYPDTIIDAVFNHMTALSFGTGIGGSSFTQYVYPGTYESQDFHYCGLEPNNNIVNYNNRLEVQTCQLLGLAECV